MIDIITIGAATRDVFLLSDAFQLVKTPASETGMFECVPLGSKIEVDKIVHSTGGGATNAAVTFAQLGLRAAAICRVGDDEAGGDVVHELRTYGVKTDLVRIVPDGQTAYSTLLTAKNGERSVLVYRGVSASFADTDIPWRKLSARWIYLTSLGGNLPLIKKILVHAKQKNIRVAWNPGKPELAHGFSKLKGLIADVDILNLNREEATRLAGIGAIKTMFKKLATAGQIVIITDADKGAYAWQDGKVLHAKTTGKKSVSRTGAGDAFGSGFVAGWDKKRDLHTALALGILNAESVIQHIGAKLGILERWPSEKETAKVKIMKV